MPRRKAVTHFVAVSDLSQSPTKQEGILVEVEGRGGDTPTNRGRALEILQQMWEKGEIASDKFPDGLTQEHIFYVPPESIPQGKTQEVSKQKSVPPIVQGAQEIIQMTKLQLEVQEVAEEAAPYLSIIQAVWERSRPLNGEERELAKNKNYGKTLEKLGTTIAKQEEYRQQSPGYGKLIINALSWQLNQGVKTPGPKRRPRQNRKTTSRKK